MLIIFAIAVGIISLLIRGYGFFHNPIPLGYDPGLYKEMFLDYFRLSSFSHFDYLSPWVQAMYEPWLGMIGSLAQHIGIGFSDHWLTRGRALVSIISVSGVYVLGSSINKKIGVWALILALLSFTQYAAYWRSYRKQILGLFIICITLRSRSKYKIWQTVPLLIATALINRASGILLGAVAVLRMFILLYRKEYNCLKVLFISGAISALLIYPIILPFWDTLILPGLAPFIQSIDLPALQESFQGGGTFLSIHEYLRVSWPVLIAGLAGLIYSIRQHRNTSPIVFATLILLLRVFGQGFFFQRMIGYLDIFLCICSGVFFFHVEKSFCGKYIIGCILLLQSYYLYYGYTIIHQPLISTQELNAITAIANTMEPNATTIVPGIRYSPRIQGRTSGQVLAPGLFDINIRGNAGDNWAAKRYNQPATTKCKHLASDYPQIINTPVYIRIGSKQGPDSYTGGCFKLLTGSNMPYYRRYQVDWNNSSPVSNF